MSLEETFSRLSLLIVYLYLKYYRYTFCLYFILYYLHVWIQIHIRNPNSDPESTWIRIQYKTGFTTLIIPDF